MCVCATYDYTDISNYYAVVDMLINQNKSVHCFMHGYVKVVAGKVYKNTFKENLLNFLCILIELLC